MNIYGNHGDNKLHIYFEQNINFTTISFMYLYDHQVNIDVL